MTNLISVSTDDILKRLNYNSYFCAIANAFYREGFIEIFVTSKRIRFVSCHPRQHHLYKFDSALESWAAASNSGKPVEPITITLNQETKIASIAT